jgi:hypothetical protein
MASRVCAPRPRTLAWRGRASLHALAEAASVKRVRLRTAAVQRIGMGPESAA